MPGCPFCAIVEGRSPSHHVADDEHAVAFLDINPIVDGHVLVVPRRHAADLFDIEPADAASVMAAAVRVAAMQKQALACDGVTMIHASGRAAWQSVFHFHLHLLPRYAGDGLRPGDLVFGRRGDRAALASIAERLRNVSQ